MTKEIERDIRARIAKAREEGTQPAPLTGPDCNVRQFPAFMLDLRLRESDFWYQASDAAKVAAINLWMVAWRRVPAASLPNDEKRLAELAGVGLRQWRGLTAKGGAKSPLHGWVLCTDDRWYHPILAADATRARQSSETGRAAALQRHSKAREHFSDQRKYGPFKRLNPLISR